MPVRIPAVPALREAARRWKSLPLARACEDALLLVALVAGVAVMVVHWSR